MNWDYYYLVAFGFIILLTAAKFYALGLKHGGEIEREKFTAANSSTPPNHSEPLKKSEAQSEPADSR